MVGVCRHEHTVEGLSKFPQTRRRARRHAQPSCIVKACSFEVTLLRFSNPLCSRDGDLGTTRDLTSSYGRPRAAQSTERLVHQEGRHTRGVGSSECFPSRWNPTEQCFALRQVSQRCGHMSLVVHFLQCVNGLGEPVQGSSHTTLDQGDPAEEVSVRANEHRSVVTEALLVRSLGDPLGISQTALDD